jgi:signal transduction histidine kinase
MAPSTVVMNSIKDREMRLLFIGPDNESTAKAKLALQRRQELSIIEMPYPEASLQLFSDPRPDLVFMVSHPNILHWISTIEHLGWNGPSFILIRPAEHGLADKLLNHAGVECMGEESLELPFFSTLLKRIANRAQDQAASGPNVNRFALIHDQAFIGTLGAMMRSLTQSLDPDTVLDRLLAALLDLISCDAADIRLVNGDDVVMTRASGYPDDHMLQPEHLRYSLQSTRNLLQVATERHAVLVDDTTTYEGWLKLPDSDWIRSHLTAPLFLDDDLVGFLNVSSRRPHAFNSSDLEALEILAPLAAVALHNARLYHSLSQERNQLMALTDIDQRILAMSDSPQIVMRTILAQALRLLGLPKGISILSRFGRQPELVHTQGIGSVEATEQLMLANWEQEESRFEEGGPGLHIAMETRPTTPPRLAEWAEEEGVEALLTIPLWLHGRLVGRIMLLDTSPHPWKDREIEVARRLARQAAIAIDKALLVQKLRQQLLEAENLNRVLQAAGTTLDAEQVLNNVCIEAKHILQVPRVSAGIIEEGKLQWVGEACTEPYTPAASQARNSAHSLALLQAMYSNKPLAFADLQERAPAWLTDLVQPITRSALVIPLAMREDRLGFLLAESPAPHPFTGEGAHLMESIAAAIIPTLENAWLFRQVQKARTETEAAYGELRRLDALKSQFIQNVSHEFRTPLAIVKGYVDLLVEGALDITESSDLLPALHAIHTHTDNLVRLVESITTLNDLEVGKLHPVSQPIQPICHAAVQANWQKALRRQIEITTRISDDLPNLKLDAEGVLRALSQCLDNAIKFSYDGGHIWLDAFIRDHHMWLQVRDEGIGIPEAELGRIFDRFYQINGATNRRYGGMGLGLSLVREVVQSHRGSVWAESPGANLGTTMTIRLPLQHGTDGPVALAQSTRPSNSERTYEA